MPQTFLNDLAPIPLRSNRLAVNWTEMKTRPPVI
jgi:hypothetical protein